MARGIFQMTTFRIHLLGLLMVLLVGQSSAGSNSVSRILSGLLDKMADEGLAIPEVNLGSQANRLKEVKGNFSKNFSKTVDGEGSFGFKLMLKAERFSATGLYEFENLDIPGLFPVFGKGKFIVNLDNFELKVNVKPDINYETEKFDININAFNASVETSKIFFENIMNDSSLADFLNELLSSILPDLIKVFQIKIIQELQPVIDHVGNEIIRCIKTELISGHLEECIRNITLPEITWTLGAF